MTWISNRRVLATLVVVTLVLVAGCTGPADNGTDGGPAAGPTDDGAVGGTETPDLGAQGDSPLDGESPDVGAAGSAGGPIG